MAENFYLKRPTPPVFTKQADVRLPYDGNKWQEEIIGALHEQHPYLPDGKLNVSLNVRNVKEGYAIGNVNLDDRVKIPIIVDQFMLKPFDTFMKDSQLHPMQKSSLLSALEARNFGEATPPGQGEASDIFLTQSRPPFDGKYTFAAWTEGDVSAVGKALENVFGADGAEYYMAGDKDVKAVLEGAQKGDFSKMKSHGTVKPLKDNTQRKDIVKSAAVRITDRPMDELAAGIVKVADRTGQDVAGLLFDRVYDLTFGGKHDTFMFVPGDSAGYDMNNRFYGSQLGKVAEAAKVADSLPNIDPRAGDGGVWYWFEDGKLACTSYATVRDRLTTEPVYHLGGPSGAVHRTVTKNAWLKVAVAEDDVLTLPGSARFLPMQRNRAIYGRVTPDFTRDYVMVQESHGNAKIAIYRGGSHFKTYDTLTTHGAERLLGTYFEPESVAATMMAAKAAGTVKIAAHPGMFIMVPAAPVGVPADMLKRIRDNAKLAAQALFAIKDADVSSLRSAVTPELVRLDPAAAAIIKAAAEFDDTSAGARTVDNVLGLNMINESTTQRFIDGIDTLDRCKQFCMKLLMAARLGLPIDANAARTAAFALEAVVQDLEQLRHANISASDGE